MPFASTKQENYLRMHHPSVYNKFKKEGYKKGGKVEYYQYGGKNTDTVPAMLTPGEVVLNQDQQERLGNMMAGGGKAGGGQERVAALFKHIGVPGFQGGGISGLFEKGRVLLQDWRHRAGERKAKKKALKEQGVSEELTPAPTITGIVPPEEGGLEPARVPSNPPLFPHYGAEDRSSFQNLITDSVYGSGASEDRYGTEDRMPHGALISSQQFTKEFTKPKYVAKDKKEVLSRYYMGGRVKKKKKNTKY